MNNNNNDNTNNNYNVNNNNNTNSKYHYQQCGQGRSHMAVVTSCPEKVLDAWRRGPSRLEVNRESIEVSVLRRAV